MQNKYITSLYDEKYIIFLSKIYIFAKDAAKITFLQHFAILLLAFSDTTEIIFRQIT
jgi:hypothetical protein